MSSLCRMVALHDLRWLLGLTYVWFQKIGLIKQSRKPLCTVLNWYWFLTDTDVHHIFTHESVTAKWVFLFIHFINWLNLLFYHLHMQVGNDFVMSVCLSVRLFVCLSMFLSVQAITFEPLDIETSFLDQGQGHMWKNDSFTYFNM